MGDSTVLRYTPPMPSAQQAAILPSAQTRRAHQAAARPSIRFGRQAEASPANTLRNVLASLGGIAAALGPRMQTNPRLRAAGPGLLALAISSLTCGGPPDLDEDTGALAVGYQLLVNAQAMLVERCLTAPGPTNAVPGLALCDPLRREQGFRFTNGTPDRWLQSQTTGLGACLTEVGAAVVLRPCVSGSPAQKWTMTSVSTSPPIFQFELGARCLTLNASGVTVLAPCTGAKSQRWIWGGATLGALLRTMDLNSPYLDGLKPPVVLVKASPETVAETKGAILRWDLHPIAYQPKGVPQQNVGMVVVGYDGNGAARAYASAQAVRDPGRPADFHAEWRVAVGQNNYVPSELLFVGGVVSKATDVAVGESVGTSALVAMVRRDLVAASTNLALVSSSRLTQNQQRTVLARTAAAYALVLQGVRGATAATVATHPTLWSNLASSVMPLAPGNGFPTDVNAGPSGCITRTSVITGAGVTDATCSAQAVSLARYNCGYQDLTKTNVTTCNWVCCPVAL